MLIVFKLTKLSRSCSKRIINTFQLSLQDSCQAVSLRLQLEYFWLIGNKNYASISIFDIQDYAHLVVHAHETFKPMMVK